MSVPVRITHSNNHSFKKNVNLVLVAFSAFMCTFTAAGIIPAFEPIAETLHSSLQRTSYLVSMQIAVLGVAPLFLEADFISLWSTSSMANIDITSGCL